MLSKLLSQLNPAHCETDEDYRREALRVFGFVRNIAERIHPYRFEDFTLDAGRAADTARAERAEEQAREAAAQAAQAEAARAEAEQSLRGAQAELERLRKELAAATAPRLDRTAIATFSGLALLTGLVAGYFVSGTEDSAGPYALTDEGIPEWRGNYVVSSPAGAFVRGSMIPQMGSGAYDNWLPPGTPVFYQKAESPSAQEQEYWDIEPQGWVWIKYMDVRGQTADSYTSGYVLAKEITRADQIDQAEPWVFDSGNFVVVSEDAPVYERPRGNGKVLARLALGERVTFYGSMPSEHDLEAYYWYDQTRYYWERDPEKWSQIAFNDDEGQTHYGYISHAMIVPLK